MSAEAFDLKMTRARLDRSKHTVATSVDSRGQRAPWSVLIGIWKESSPRSGSCGKLRIRSLS
jgi:hypothetical protein